MAMSVTLIPGAKFEEQLRAGAMRAMRDKLHLCVRSWGKKIEADLGDFLKHIFLQTDVAKSLQGSGSVDLAAHFGLTPDEALSLCEGMASVVERSVRIGVLKGERLQIGVRAVKDDWQEFLQLPLASHLSSGGFTIPVMRWMLVDPYVDWDDVVYGIVFSGQGGSGRAHSFVKSRSGSAIMVQAGGQVSPWVVPHICVGPGGTNFIEYTLGQPDVARRCVEFVLDVLKGWQG